MAQKTVGCGVCIDGEITIFFADFSEKRLREVYVRCHVCREGAKGTASPRLGEEEITISQYYKYLDQGWREFDPV